MNADEEFWSYAQGNSWVLGALLLFLSAAAVGFVAMRIWEARKRPRRGA